ncbi:N-acyl-D-aspartate/D-glutamate deacylase [Robiginitalea myxolifaciens]|uniref:N-acyl-D-aspartate/D-glutamate deacylase n=1 Tax=Robiginitalea myxolifaciens TaxID=400055 RepID=A0A1I6H7S4_9FLAO|nr:SMP-30/gluconolactonase/LRE family protein [Robiginitalea myxolifaciens]SFR50515.1 N-acyl-D-aspartate/D-glutamate deacylase [Robiginitalea myxolifaciens]
MTFPKSSCTALLILLLAGCSQPESFDTIIRGGTILDGSGSAGYSADLGIRGDTIAAIGDLSAAKASTNIDATGLHVAPGFINMLSWANVSLLIDGRSQSDIRQGVTLEILGEGRSMGPWSEEMKATQKARQQDITYEIAWSTLGEYLQHLEDRGVSTNVASFVGNGTLREYVMGYEKREPTQQELNHMKGLLRQAMTEGAVGLSTSLIYVPSGHASTKEITELARVAADFGGMYISHIRNEEDSLLYAVRELIEIADAADIRSEIYHFKASGQDNWGLLDSAIALVEGARDRGLEVSTDMYMYNASSTGLNVLLPAWAKDGGHSSTMKLMQDPVRRRQMIAETKFHVPPENILLVGFRNPEMRDLIGKTLAEVAAERGIDTAQAVTDLIFEDNSRIQVVYFSMSEENVERKLKLPYMAICSDAGSYTAAGVFLEQSTHPRAYGSFARLLSHFVRERGVISLEEAIRRLTALPATNLGLDRRGQLQPGFFADVVVFNADSIQDKATFEEPHQYATGMEYVLVNGGIVLAEGEHTGATPGRFVKGPAARKARTTEIAEKGASLKLLSEQYSFTEGPATAENGDVYFTDQPNNRILRWIADTDSIVTFMEPAGRANGLYWDREGKLLAAADEKFELWRIHEADSIEVLTSQFESSNLNGPNDIWVHPKGWIYFTDPYYQRPWWNRQAKEIEEERVYVIREPGGEPELVADGLVQPNGIIGTEDGKYLYVADIGDAKTYRYTIGEDGSLGDRKLHAAQGSDGMTLDSEGNLYLTGYGVDVYNPAGEWIQHIPIPEDWTANITFGGKDRKTLIITAMDAVYTLRTQVPGVR